MNTQTDLALLGASGAIGRSVTAALSARNKRFCVVGRSASKLKDEFGGNPLAELATWDLNDPASIRAALRGRTTLLYTLGVPYHQFALHPQIMRRVVDAAIAEGVKRILLIGTLYVFGRAQTARITEDHPRQPHTFKGRMRKEQEDILFAAKDKLEVAVLRLPDFYGPGVEASLLHDIFVAAVEKRRANVIGPVHTPHEFVFVPDVGLVVAQLLETPGAYGQGWNLAGAGVIPPYDMAEQVFGGTPKLRVANKLMLRLAGLFNPFLRELLEMNYLMTDPLIVDDAALTRLIGPIAKTPYADGIAQCMAAARKKLK